MDIRHGDVYLREIDPSEIPADAQVIARDRFVLAEGEVTGHAHRVTGTGAELMEAPAGTYMRGTFDTALDHEQHGLVDLGERAFQVTRKREYTPQAIRPVSD